MRCESFHDEVARLQAKSSGHPRCPFGRDECPDAPCTLTLCDKETGEICKPRTLSSCATWAGWGTDPGASFRKRDAQEGPPLQWLTLPPETVRRWTEETRALEEYLGRTFGVSQFLLGKRK